MPSVKVISRNDIDNKSVL